MNVKMLRAKATCVALYLGVLVFCVHASFKDQLDWLSWKLKHNKNYETKETEIVHRQIWEKNKEYVEAHNRRKDVDFKLELNQFADKVTQKRPALFNKKKSDIFVNKITGGRLLYQPSSWDWRKKGAVTPVKNQGMLGDAQAIVTAECVESYHFIHTQVLPRLSAAEAHDCCTPTRLLNPDVFQCVHNIGGLCSFADYPSVKGSCRNDSCTATAQVDGGKKVPAGQEDMLVEAVLSTPVFAAIDASHTSFQLYQSGVYSDPNCSSTRLDHIVQVVGYGSQNGTDYWICKNSWGIEWGMQGYVLMARNKGNMCGIASVAVYPV